MAASRANFKSAFDYGFDYINYLVKNDIATLEDVIFYAMANNPYTTKTSKANFINGVSMRVNQIQAFKNHAMNEHGSSL